MQEDSLSMSHYIKNRCIGWEEYLSLIESLAEKIAPSPKSVLAIGRGGLILGLLFSHQFCATLHILLAKSYKGRSQKKLKLSSLLNLPGECLSSPFVVVDDIADTGATLEGVCMMLSKMSYERGKDFFFATLFCKPWAKIKPEFFVEEVMEWIIFPYERRD